MPAGSAKSSPHISHAQCLTEHSYRDSGWKVRVFTTYGGPGLRKASPGATPRQLWGPPDNRTLVLVVDPTAPNILNMTYVGDDVLFKLRRPFLQEVQSRWVAASSHCCMGCCVQVDYPACPSLPCRLRA